MFELALLSSVITVGALTALLLGAGRRPVTSRTTSGTSARLLWVDSSSTPNTLEIVGRIDRPVGTVALSPDGHRLLATGTDVESRHDEAGVVTPHGLCVLDPVSLEELEHNPASGLMRVAGFSRDGGIAYLQSWQDERSGGQVCVVSSLRLDRLEITAQRRVSGYCDIIAAPAS
jgi:hypothetical protein